MGLVTLKKERNNRCKVEHTQYLVSYLANTYKNDIINKIRCMLSELDLGQKLRLCLGLKIFFCQYADSGFFQTYFQYQGGMKSTVFRVFEDLKFKI